LEADTLGRNGGQGKGDRPYAVRLNSGDEEAEASLHSFGLLIHQIGGAWNASYRAFSSFLAQSKKNLSG
jgi:hypothetical protein